MILYAHSMPRYRERSTKRRSHSENMGKDCLFFSQSNMNRALPRDLIPERKLMNVHAYNLFMSSIFVTYLTLIRVTKCAHDVIYCWQGLHRNIPKNNCSMEVYCEEKYHFFLFLIGKRSPKTYTVLLLEQQST